MSVLFLCYSSEFSVFIQISNFVEVEVVCY